VYKNTTYLGRLLQSIAEQTCTDYEVVIADDSPNEVVEVFLQANFSGLPIVYHKNERALGTPANWNKAIDLAKGTWIKLMHDDDWFAHKEVLSRLKERLQAHQPALVYTNYRNVALSDLQRTTQKMTGSAARRKFVYKHPEALYARNIIGPPSVILVHRSISNRYDERMKWLVDIDFYMQLLPATPVLYIEEVMINVGLSDEQVTQFTYKKPEVEIPEGLMLLQKLGNRVFNNMLYYDAWWRLLRNLEIRSTGQLQSFAKDLPIPLTLKKIVRHQCLLPSWVLKIGVLSKLFMAISWGLQKLRSTFVGI
jgi:glycosyltransferase involved in cell wall biosynthesis